jgi:hypothetical protein
MTARDERALADLRDYHKSEAADSRFAAANCAGKQKRSRLEARAKDHDRFVSVIEAVIRKVQP